MSDLKKDAAPIVGRLIRGMGTNLGHAAQSTVARWVYKTALTTALANPSLDSRPFPPHYGEFYEAREPRKNAMVLVASWFSEEHVSYTHFQPVSLTQTGEPIPKTPNGYIATLGIGEFVGQVWVMPNFAQDGHITVEGSLASRVQPIQPLADPFIWPPGPTLSFGELATIAATNLPVAP
jgi:hypothetical protein